MSKEKDRTNEGLKRMGAGVYAAALGTILVQSMGESLEFPLPPFVAHALYIFEGALATYFGVNQFRVKIYKNVRRYYNNVLRRSD